MKALLEKLLMAAVCGLVMGVVLLVGLRVSPLNAGPEMPDVVQAKSFQMVDNYGKVRAMLFMSKEGPAFIMSDTSGIGMPISVVARDISGASVRVGDIYIGKDTAWNDTIRVGWPTEGTSISKDGVFVGDTLVNCITTKSGVFGTKYGRKWVLPPVNAR